MQGGKWKEDNMTGFLLLSLLLFEAIIKSLKMGTNPKVLSRVVDGSDVCFISPFEIMYRFKSRKESVRK